MMNCKELVMDFLLDYVDRSLPEEKMREFEQHISDCPECIVFVSTYRKTGEIFKRSIPEDQPIPPELAHKLITFLKDEIAY